jgi:transcriptional regulator with XRE-family HTH domain
VSVDGELSRAFRRELRVACDAAGLSQRRLAARAGISASRLNRVLLGSVATDLDLAERLVQRTGHRLMLRVLPADGVRLRDSGQLAIAERIVREAHASWRRRLELPVGRPPDRRAADLVLDSPAAAIHIEIERRLNDLQAQLRAAQLKRASLSELLGQRVRLVLALSDTTANRQAVAPFSTLLAEALPIGRRGIWAAIRSGEPLGGDGLLWVRAR